MKKIIAVSLVAASLVMGSSSVFAAHPRQLIKLPAPVVAAPVVTAIKVGAAMADPSYQDNTKTVKVSVVMREGDRWLQYTTATGFLLPNGYIVTNNHVAPASMPGVDEIAYRITFYNQRGDAWAAATLAATEVHRDISILKVATEKMPADYRGSYFDKFDTSYTWGEKVKVIGHPVYAADNKTFTTITYTWKNTQGTIVNGYTEIGRKFYDEDQNSSMGVIEMDVEAHVGNSGGPVINEAGELVGVVTANATGTRKTFAIRANDLLGMIEANNLTDEIFN